MEIEADRLKKELGNHEKLLSKKEEELKTLEARLGKLKASRDKLLEKRKEEASESETEKIELEKEMAVLSSAIDRIMNELKLLESAGSELEKTKKKYETVEQRIRNISSEIDERENGIIRTFNTEIKSLYEKMGFEKVDELRIDKEFNLRVIRKSKAGAGKEDVHSVKSLSKTEREVAGLILLLSGYRAFRVAEKYPIFVIDEVSFMDPKRLKEFVDYTKNMAQAVVLATIPGREIDIEGVNRIVLKV